MAYHSTPPSSTGSFFIPAGRFVLLLVIRQVDEVTIDFQLPMNASGNVQEYVWLTKQRFDEAHNEMFKRSTTASQVTATTQMKRNMETTPSLVIWKGPYLVKKRISEVNYEITDTDN